MNKTVRNVEIRGRRTSFRLEQDYWDAVDDCARDRGWTANQLITHAVSEHRLPEATMASAVRMFVLGYYRDQVVHEDSDRRTGHA